jgi:nucleotide-binding universal stress UspA family protein
MKRIVVGIDGSELGWSALDRAAELARATGASLQIAHISPPAPSPFAAEDYAAAAAGWMAAQETYAHGLLREAVSRVKDSRLEVEPVIKLGTPAEALAELAQASEVTMAVVGHRGRNLAARLFVGSVADRLVQICSKPVLVVR